MYALVTTKLHKEQEFYLDLMRDLAQNDSLKKMMQSMWNIPTNEDINIYKIDAVTNDHTVDAVHSMPMSPVRRPRHRRESDFLSHHIKVNSASLQVATNDFMVVDDGQRFTDSTSTESATEWDEHE